ncbi:hypothetical protein MUB16_24035 [Priestia sp. OVL9]|nr:hypothetical protein [Priestia sp. OVL9]
MGYVIGIPLKRGERNALLSYFRGDHEEYCETILLHEKKFCKETFQSMVREAMNNKPGKIDRVDIVKYLIGHHSFQVAHIEAGFHSTYSEKVT